MRTVFPTKLVTFTLIIVALASLLHANDVTTNDILFAAGQWISQNAIFQAELPDAAPEAVTRLYDADGNPLPLWRVTLAPSGYLVMSSDDTLPPVVAFDTESDGVLQDDHPLKSMLRKQGDIFQNELDREKTRGGTLARENRSRWNSLLSRTRAESVIPSKIIRQPMLTTEWNQREPFNFLCPSGEAYTERAVTGCVQTAIAQMLKFHEWPPYGIDTQTFEDRNGDIKCIIMADYSFPYEWSLMKDKYDTMNEDAVTASELAVARISMEPAAFTKADYELSSTSAYSHDIKTLISQNLRYHDTAVFGCTKSGYVGYTAQTTLYARIRADMVAGRPAFTSYDGHEFIADGLGTMDDLDYYHLNYGWGGYQNGWYLLTSGYNNTVIVAATTGISPLPVPVFKPLSCEQSSSFTLSWDFPKRLTAEAFRLTKNDGTSASTVITSSIAGTSRQYTLTEQSGTNTYTLEAKVNGNWQAASEGVTITVKSNPMPMLTIAANDEYMSLDGKTLSTTITANNTLKSLTVTCSRPDILPSSGILITGSGATRTMQLSHAAIGNALLYITATDSVGNVTKKTALFRVDTLATLASISVEGDETIPVGGSATYSCKATWGDGSSSDVTPTWSLSPTTYASVDNTGEVTNKNTTPDNQTVTLKASFTFGGVTKTLSKTITLEKRILESISITGDDNIASGDAATYSCMASWNDGSSSEVTPTWRPSPTTYASVDNSGEVTNKNTTPNNQTVTLSASFTFGGVNKTSSKTITLGNRVLESISITGDDSIASGDAATYSCTASWSNGATSAVTPTWSISSTEHASIDAAGTLTNKNKTDTEQTVTIFANYESWGISKKAELNVTLSTLASITIEGDDIISPVGSATYTCKATWGDGSTSDVTPTWSLSSTEHASINADGNITNKNETDADKTVTIFASYESGGVTKTAELTVTLAATLAPLASIAIEGDDIIHVGESAIYICKANWGDGSSFDVTPTWSLSPTTYASIDNSGKVTNKNTTPDNQTVTLKASFTFGGATKTARKTITLEKRILESISITGVESIAKGDATTYFCTAFWNDGTMSAATPTWSLSSTEHATIDDDGTLTNNNKTAMNQTVTIFANYKSGEVTKTAELTVTLAPLASIAIEGDDIIHIGGSATYICKATWGDGSSSDVTPTWSLSTTTYASVDNSGKVTNNNTSATNQTVTLQASFTFGNVTKTSSKAITLEKRILDSICITGVDSIASGGSATYSCTASWSDGTTSDVTPSWSLLPSSYATLSNGKVTNKNTTDTDQAVTVKATYSFGEVSRTAEKAITLEKRTLVSIAVSGNATISGGNPITYSCNATWSDGTTSAVTPKWSLSSVEHATVDETGKVTNKNTTAEEQTVTLTASYTFGGIAKTAQNTLTLTKRTLKSLSITGQGTIPSGGSCIYVCKAIWNDGTTSEVTPTWSLSSTDYASVDGGGNVTNKNTTNNNQIVNITATYAFADSVKKAEKVVTLTKLTLASIAIEGDDSIPFGGSATYKCTATWSDGTTSTVTPEGSRSSTTYSTVDSNGKVTNKNTTANNKTVTITASYGFAGIAKTAEKAVTLTKRTLASIAIEGDDIINLGSSAKFTCTATWSDGTTSAAVSPTTWSLSSTTYASVDASGKVTNKNNTTDDKTVTLKARFTFGGTNWNAEKTITIKGKEVVRYSLSVINGTGGGEFEAGVKVTATAGTPHAGEVFSQWNAIGITMTDEQRKGKSVTFDMPPNDVTLTAVFIRPILEITISIKKGWHLYALPLEPDAESAALLKGVGICRIFANKKYATPDSFLAGQGFWLYSESEMKLHIKGTEAEPLPLKSGWNLVLPSMYPEASTLKCLRFNGKTHAIFNSDTGPLEPVWLFYQGKP